MTNVDRYMLQGERPLQVFKHHWVWLLKKLWLTTTVLIVALLLFQNRDVPYSEWILLSLMICILIVLAYWNRHVFIITNERLIQTGHIFDFLASTDVSPLSHVQNIDVNRTPWWKSLLGSVDYKIQTGHGMINLHEFPEGIDTFIWGARQGKTGGNMKYPPAEGKIIVE